MTKSALILLAFWAATFAVLSQPEPEQIMGYDVPKPEPYLSESKPLVVLPNSVSYYTCPGAGQTIMVTR